ncbi:MAG: ABC transporter substrate-binding protein [Hyphomicrobium sp.]
MSYVLRSTFAALALLALVAGSFNPVTAHAAPADAAAAKYSIAVFTSQPVDRCFNTGVNKAIEHFVRRRIEALNGLGEFSARRLRVDFYNDYSDPELAVANVGKALADPTTLAMIGLSGSNRAKSVFEKLGPDIAKSNIPFITDMSVTGLFDPYPNVFTMRPSQENERLPVIARFIKDGNYARPAFVGIADSVASAELAKLLKENTDAAQTVATHELPVKDGKIDDMNLKAAVADLKTRDADLVLVMLGAAPIEQFMIEAAAAGLRSEVFLLTDNEKALRSEGAKGYGQTLYQLAWQTLPEVYNSRLRQDMLARAGDRWMFTDTANSSAPGWAAKTCKAPAAGQSGGGAASLLDSDNLRAIARGTRFGDMAGLIGEILKTSPPEIALEAARARIVDGLKTDFAAGRGTFRGAFDNWSFHPLRRTASQSPYILKKSRTSATPRLASRQYVKLRNEALREIKTVYMDLDLTRIFRIDDNEKSFFAEFFLTMNSGDGFDVASIDFANAFLEADGGGQKVTVLPLHSGGASGVYPEGVQIFKVTGKFMTRPDFSNYPFDTQLFAIEMKPKSGDAAFIVQPPPAALRDRVVETDGWRLKDQYVGYNEDYIPVTDARTDEKSIVPFYKAEFAFIMQREATDYYLRVVVPLAFILIVAFLSIFIPREHFEAVVTIQVTALLAAVALYLSIPKVGNDAATVSDRIFLLDYLAVSLMIAISVARVNPWMRHFPGLDRVLKFVHVLGVPLLIIGMAYYLADMKWSQDAQVWYGEEQVAQQGDGNGATPAAKPQ